jgi:hypothetical protein
MRGMKGLKDSCWYRPVSLRQEKPQSIWVYVWRGYGSNFLLSSRHILCAWSQMRQSVSERRFSCANVKLCLWGWGTKAEPQHDCARPVQFLQILPARSAFFFPERALEHETEPEVTQP